MLFDTDCQDRVEDVTELPSVGLICVGAEIAKTDSVTNKNKMKLKIFHHTIYDNITLDFSLFVLWKNQIF